jgi:hypothetical protein
VFLRPAVAACAGAIRLNEQAENWSKRAIDEEKFNRTIRKFPKEVGVTWQHEIGAAVREAIPAGHLRGNEKFEATMTLKICTIRLTHVVNGEIELRAGPAYRGDGISGNSAHYKREYRLKA